MGRHRMTVPAATPATLPGTDIRPLPEHRAKSSCGHYSRSAWKENSRKFAMGKATLASPTLPTGGYRILMPVHYLPDAILGSIDHRNPESRQLDHDDARPQQVRANGVRAKIFPR